MKQGLYEQLINNLPKDHIRLIAYQAKFVSGEIKLIEHDEFNWTKHNQLIDFMFAPADIKFVEMLSQ